MTDFFIGFFFAFPTAFLLSLALAYLWAHYCFKIADNSIADDVTIIKEDVSNLTVKLSGFLSHV